MRMNRVCLLKLPKVLFSTGNRRVPEVVSGEKDRATTVMCAVNAIGVYIPSFLIFGRVLAKQELLRERSPGANAIAEKSRWMVVNTILIFSQHFIIVLEINDNNTLERILFKLSPIQRERQ